MPYKSDISILIQPFLFKCHPQGHATARTLLGVLILWMINMTSHKAVFLSSSVSRRATTTVKVNPWRPVSPLTLSLSWLVGITKLALHLVFGPPHLCYRQCVFLPQAPRTEEFTCGALRVGWRWPCWTESIKVPSALFSLTPGTWCLLARAPTWWDQTLVSVH